MTALRTPGVRKGISQKGLTASIAAFVSTPGQKIRFSYFSDEVFHSLSLSVIFCIQIKQQHRILKGRIVLMKSMSSCHVKTWVLSRFQLHQTNTWTQLSVNSQQPKNMARHVLSERLALDSSCTNCFHLSSNAESCVSWKMPFSSCVWHNVLENWH